MDYSQSKIEITPLGKMPELGASTIAPNLMLEAALKRQEGCIYEVVAGAYVEKTIADLEQMLIAHQGRKLLENRQDNDPYSVLYSWDHGMVEITLPEGNFCHMRIFSFQKEFAVKLVDELRSYEVPPAKQQGYIFAIMRAPPHGGLQLTRIGYAGTPLERGNYSEKVLRDYDFVVQDLKAQSPSGRIVILEGAPGVGKTFIARSLLMEVPDAMFILVPPDMVSSMGGPELLPLLLDNKERHGKKGPTIFLLEDADACLVPRQDTDMSSISSILNIGDGIFGSLFDIRIIATTNADYKKMDAAIIRAGRLSKRIEVKQLDYQKANEVFQRLVPGKEMPIVIDEEELLMKPLNKKTKFSLAEVYQAARQLGWLPAERSSIVTPTSELKVAPFPYYDDE
jgi:hypothetical protein